MDGFFSLKRCKGNIDGTFSEIMILLLATRNPVNSPVEVGS